MVSHSAHVRTIAKSARPSFCALLSFLGLLSGYALVLTLLGGRLAWQPDAFGFSLDGDAAKNYYTFHYHILHGSGWWFEGMNYPFGDHLVYADAQPLLSVPLAWLQQQGWPIDQHIPGLLNAILLWSPFAGLLALYRSLRLLGSQRLWAGGAAGAMLLGSPQWMRLAGHYGLVYPIIPVLLWLLLEIRLPAKTPVMPLLRKLGLSFGIGVFSLTAALLHPYHLATILLVLAAAGAWSVVQRRWMEALLQWMPAALAFLAFRGILAVGPSVAGRPTHPYGFETERLQAAMLTWSRWMQHMDWQPSDTRVLEMEFNTYLGILPLLGTLLVPILLFRFWQSMCGSAMPEGQAQAAVAPLPSARPYAAIGVLIWIALAGASLASFFPFRLFGDAWTDALPPLRQFRVLARFGWVAYYAWTLAFAACIGLHIRRMAKPEFRFAATAVLLFLWGTDAFFHTRPVFSRIHQPIDGIYLQTEEDYNWLLKKGGYGASDFQSILALPYFHVGSEQFQISGTTQIQNAAWSASIQTGLPLHNVDLSRQSYVQTLLQLQLLNRGGATSLDHVPDERPLLVLAHPRAMDTHGKALLERAVPIAADGPYTVYRLPLKRLLPSPAPQTAANTEDHTAHPPNALTYTHAGNPFFSKTVKPGSTDVLLFRFWMQDRLDIPHMPALLVEGFSASGERLWQRSRRLNHRLWDIPQGGPWLAIEDTVHWGPKTARIQWALDQDSIRIGNTATRMHKNSMNLHPAPQNRTTGPK